MRWVHQVTFLKTLHHSQRVNFYFIFNWLRSSTCRVKLSLRDFLMLLPRSLKCITRCLRDTQRKWFWALFALDRNSLAAFTCMSVLDMTAMHSTVSINAFQCQPFALLSWSVDWVLAQLQVKWFRQVIPACLCHLCLRPWEVIECLMLHALTVVLRLHLFAQLEYFLRP